jgi:Threonine dehydrogenase and related Zn-dependent dehydrogenases
VGSVGTVQKGNIICVLTSAPIGLSGGGGGFAENVVVDESRAVVVPEGFPTEYTALVEPLAVGIHAVRQSDLRAGDDVVVIGCGPIGLATILAAQAQGAGRVFASASRDSRREIAKTIGVDETINPNTTDPIKFVQSRTDNGADAAFEVAGSGSSLDQAVQCTTRDGDITIVSLFEENIEFDPNPLVHGERTVRGIFAYESGPLGHRDYKTVIKLIDKGQIDPEPLVTGRVSLENIVTDGFERLTDRAGGHVKILVKP